MPPSDAILGRSGLVLGTLLTASACLTAQLPGQELPLLRDYPGSGPYVCPTPVAPIEPSPEEGARAAQLATDANQALLLGDFERTESLLAQAIELDPVSADLAFRHARTYEDIDDPESAMLEYCRAIATGAEAIGVLDDSRERINSLHEAVRALLPEEARQAFILGLTHADSTRFASAISAFSIAVETAPDWGAPVFNRALVYEQLGFIQESLADYRTYLDLAPSDIDPILVVVSERIGLLEGIASVGTPSPTGALAVGMVPGMGHYYTGRPIGGTVTLVSAGAAFAAGLLVKEITTLCLEDVPAGGMCPEAQIVDEFTSRPYAWYGLGIGAAITLIGAVEASLKAKRRRADSDAITGPLEDPGLTMVLPSVSVEGTRVDFNLVRVRFR